MCFAYKSLLRKGALGIIKLVGLHFLTNWVLVDVFGKKEKLAVLPLKRLNKKLKNENKNDGPA